MGKGMEADTEELEDSAAIWEDSEKEALAPATVRAVVIWAMADLLGRLPGNRIR